MGAIKLCWVRTVVPNVSYLVPVKFLEEIKFNGALSSAQISGVSTLTYRHAGQLDGVQQYAEDKHVKIFVNHIVAIEIIEEDD